MAVPGQFVTIGLLAGMAATQALAQTATPLPSTAQAPVVQQPQTYTVPAGSIPKPHSMEMVFTWFPLSPSWRMRES
jgi:hypothetical protein